MTSRWQFSLAGIFVVVTLAALVFAAITWLPEEFPKEPYFVISAVLSDMFFIALASAILLAVGNRTYFDFAVGFVAFAGAELVTGGSSVIITLHRAAFVGLLAKLGVNYEMMVYSNMGGVPPAIFFGVIGGLFSLYLGRRQKRRQAENAAR